MCHGRNKTGNTQAEEHKSRGNGYIRRLSTSCIPHLVYENYIKYEAGCHVINPKTKIVAMATILL